MPDFTLQQLAELLGAQLRVNPDLEANPPAAIGDRQVTGIGTLSDASDSQLSFLTNSSYVAQLRDTRAAAVLVDASLAAQSPVPVLIHPSPHLAYAQLSTRFETESATDALRHPAASIDPTAQLAASVSVGAGAVIESGAVLADGVVIGANCVVGANAQLGANCLLRPGVVLGHGVVLGESVQIWSGAVIGSDGFGFAVDPGSVEESGERYRWQRIAHLGTVRIGNRVSIGANTTIDRGSLGDTIIEDDVIIDNLVQVAHNVVIGRGTAIAGCAGIAGSARIGRYCSIGGAAGIAGHISIADGTTILGQTLVNKSITRAGAYASGGRMQEAGQWRKNAVRITQLDELNRRVRALERSAADEAASSNTSE